MSRTAECRSHIRWATCWTYIKALWRWNLIAFSLNNTISKSLTWLCIDVFIGWCGVQIIYAQRNIFVRCLNAPTMCRQRHCQCDNALFLVINFLLWSRAVDCNTSWVHVESWLRIVLSISQSQPLIISIINSSLKYDTQSWFNMHSNAGVMHCQLSLLHETTIENW